MQSDDDLIRREVDPDSEVYDDLLDDLGQEEVPDNKVPGEEIDPDSTKVDPDRGENSYCEEVYDDEEHRQPPF